MVSETVAIFLLFIIYYLLSIIYYLFFNDTGFDFKE